MSHLRSKWPFPQTKMKIRSSRKNAKQKPEKCFVKTATAFETSAVISIRPYQRQRFKISSSSKHRRRTAVWSPSTHGRSIRKHCGFWHDGELSKRKPTLSLRLSGSFLLRIADRQLSALLFQLPPRLTRLELLTTARPLFYLTGPDKSITYQVI